MDLHAWIAQQIDHAEALAADATAGPWHVTEYTWYNDFDAGIGTAPGEVDVVGHGYEGGGVTYLRDAQHIAAHDPAAVLLRCEADRRILARHRLDPDITFEVACRGCRTYGDMDLSYTDNLNECPELLDLAHAHGLTDEILASLDRPQPPEQPKREPHPEGFAGMLRDAFTAALTLPLTTSDVPEALRGPRWKPTP